jgi:hypothetical protein
MSIVLRWPACVLVLALGACSEYLDRRDTILLGAGDAVQSNIVVHTIDPWPAAARRVFEPTNGDRLVRAVERYRNTQSGATGTAAAPPQAGAAAAPSSSSFGSGAPVR